MTKWLLQGTAVKLKTIVILITLQTHFTLKLQLERSMDHIGNNKDVRVFAHQQFVFWITTP